MNLITHNIKYEWHFKMRIVLELKWVLTISAVATHRKTLDENNTEVNLNVVLDDLKEGLALQINHSNAKIECDFEKLNSFIYPKGHVRSILQNLTYNSLKYSTSNRKSEEKISSMKEDEFVRISVADNGKGIPSEKIDYIFGLFKRLDKDYNEKGMDFISLNHN